MSLDQETKQLELLKKEYNAAIIRYNKMVDWCETASIEDQEKQYKNIVDVINSCNKLLNQIKAIDPLITPGEVLYGFKEVR